MKRRIRSKLMLITAWLSLGVCGFAVHADEHGVRVPGFSSERLQRVSDWIDRRVETGSEGGLQVLITRRGEVVFQKSAGELHSGTSMGSDGIFYIHSMTKPITSAAVMMLFEEGHFNLFDPVSLYLPEFADMRIYVEGAGDAMVTRPANEAITILHLLTHTSGLVYDFVAENRELASWYSENLQPPENLEQMSLQLSRAPLAFEPGSAWEYSQSTTVLARLVEVVSQQPFAEFLAERIFTPLKMVDTRHHLLSKDVTRRSTSFVRDADGLLRDQPFPIEQSLIKPTYTAGDSGLYSTAKDYWRFCQMLLNEGTLDGEQVLSPKAVRLMFTDFVPPSVAKMVLPPGRGYGLAFSVYGEYHQTQSLVSPGAVTWPGSGGGFFLIDPKEELIVVLMTQTYPPNLPAMQSTLETLIYQSLDSQR